MEWIKMRKRRIDELNRISTGAYQRTHKIPLVVVLDNIRSCHNIGSVFRTCDALLVQEIILCGITATPPNKEIHKTALDAEKSVKWEYKEHTEEALKELRAGGFRIFAVEQVHGSTSLIDFQPVAGEKLALIFGNEVKGIRQPAVDLCDGAIEIPQYGTKHSFNISVSAGIVLWDIFQKLKAQQNS